MPEAAIAACAVDFILPLDEIAQVIRGLVEANSS
jgi:chemotaxis response regulator CheB